MNDFLRLITLQDATTRTVLLGAGLLGLAAGVVGTFAVLRRRALVGDAMAHAALPGVCLAYFVVGERSFGAFLLGALIAGLLGAWCIVLIRSHTRIKEDAAIGIVLASFFGLGIALSRIIQNRPTGNRAGLDTFILGKAAGMTSADTRLIGITAVTIVALTYLLAREFGLLCFDRAFSASIGRRVILLDLILMTLIGVCVVIGLPAVGVVMTAALLIIPAAAARFWTDRLWVMILLGGLFGSLSGLLGVGVSALAPRLAAGPVVVLVAAGIFVVSLIAAPTRGLLPASVRRWRLRRRIILQNLLRAMHEANERGEVEVTEAALAAKRAWTTDQLASVLARAARSGLVVHGPMGWRLTPRGVAEAAGVVRTHRLWELYLIEHAAIAPDHVDRDADQLEHILPPDVLARLEEQLAMRERLPPSPHAIPVYEGSAAHG